MVDSVQPVKVSLWRAGFDLFARHWKEWLKWAVGFFILMALLQIIFFDPTLAPSIDQLNDKMIAAKKAGQKLATEDSAAQLHLAIHAALLSLPLLAAILLQAYVYLVFFLQRQLPLTGDPVLSVGRFFCWLWKCLLLGLLYILLSMLAIIPAAAGIWLGKIHWTLTVAGVLLSVAGFIYMIYVMMRLWMGPIFAACAIKPSFRISWNVMKGNCWRVIGNSLLFMLVMLLLGLLAAIAEKAILEILHALLPGLFASLPTPDTPPAHPVLMRLLSPPVKSYGLMGAYIGMVFNAANLCAFSGFLRAFIAATTHILYQERKIAGGL